MSRRIRNWGFSLSVILFWHGCGFSHSGPEFNDCKPGEVRTCYDGPDGTAGVGLCAVGTQTCQANGLWGECFGQILAAEDLCDGKDNNCDGKSDESFSSAGQVCTLGIGECAAQAVMVCTTDGKGLLCPAVPRPPSDEKCDGRDNDCDGTVDEGCLCLDGERQACYTGPAGTNGVGLCKEGKQACEGGNWRSCEGEIKPSEEVCDMKDNDCDGQTDEGSVCLPPPSSSTNVTVALPNPPVSPSSLIPTVVSPSQIDLTWQDNSSDEQGYRIQRKQGTYGSFVDLATLPPNTIVYSDTGLSGIITYHYRVYAFHATAISGFSNTVSIGTETGLGPCDD